MTNRNSGNPQNPGSAGKGSMSRDNQQNQGGQQRQESSGGSQQRGGTASTPNPNQSGSTGSTRRDDTQKR
jgi:hypothetical protein